MAAFMGFLNAGVKGIPTIFVGYFEPGHTHSGFKYCFCFCFCLALPRSTVEIHFYLTSHISTYTVREYGYDIQ